MTNKNAVPLLSPGFSLLELLIVIALMGLISALIAPVVTNNLTKVRLKTAAQKTVATLRYARNQAISEKRPFWVVLDREKNILVVLDRPLESESETNVRVPEFGTISPAVKVYAYPDDLRIEKIVVGNEEITESQGEFVFHPNGTCSGGEIYLQADDYQPYFIRLDFITGSAKIEVGEKEKG